jgi:hypothetical protein
MQFFSGSSEVLIRLGEQYRKLLDKESIARRISIHAVGKQMM